MNNKNGKQMFLLIGAAILSVEIALVMILSAAMKDRTPKTSGKPAAAKESTTEGAEDETEKPRKQSPGDTEETEEENAVFTEKDYYEVKPAFYIQAKVLEWAGYPAIRTSDDYFDLIQSFAEENPVTPEGDPYITYLTPEDEDYMDLLYSGRVLGTYDIWADFGQEVTEAFRKNGMREEGCDYLPLLLSVDGEKPDDPEDAAETGADYEVSRRALIRSINSGAFETVLACLDAYGAETYAEFADLVREGRK